MKLYIFSKFDYQIYEFFSLIWPQLHLQLIYIDYMQTIEMRFVNIFYFDHFHIATLRYPQYILDLRDHKFQIMIT